MSECIFCDRKNFEEFIILETTDFWVIAGKGQLTDGGYSLVVPKVHIPCMAALKFYSANSPTERMLETTRSVFSAISLEYQKSSSRTPHPVTIFEHGVVGQTIQHAHLHILPLVVDPTPRIQSDFPKSEIAELQYVAHLEDLYAERQEPYLFWSKPGGQAMVCWNPPAPPQYMRKVFADILGRPERANWREMDPELDKKLRSETVRRLKPRLSAIYTT